MYIRVYAPNGEAFDVTRERADKLILQEGWTQIPPKTSVKKKPALIKSAPSKPSDAE